MTGFLLLFRFVWVVFFVAFAGLASAQMSEEGKDEYRSWLATAKRAEAVVDSGKASDAALEKLRSEIADHREEFAASRVSNSARIRTLESQISALGEQPENGEEPEDIARLRAGLTEQLDALMVPRVVSEEAFNRANGLIGEIDRIIRERQTSQLLARGPSPLNPAYWPIALRDIDRAVTAIVNESVTAWKSGPTILELKQNLPVLLAMIVLGLVLLTQGGRWSERLGDYLREFGGRGTGVWSFVVSLARIILPLIGLLILCQVAILSGLLGLRGTLIVDALPSWGATILIFNWVITQVYNRREADRVIDLAVEHKAEVKILVLLLALMLVCFDAILLYEKIENISDQSRAVVGFPPILISAMLLLRVQRVGMRQKKSDEKTDDSGPPKAGFFKIVRSLRRGVVIFSLLAPFLAAAGYSFAAEAIIYPAIQTLIIISIVLTLQRFVGDLYGWISGVGDAGRDSLFSALAGFVLSLFSLPFLALAWGARVADLTELWTRFLEGFDIGGVRISPIDFLTFALIFSIGYTVTRLIQGSLRNNLLPKTGIDPGGQNAIVSGTGYVGIFLAALVALTGTGIDLSSLAIVAGALSVGIGFGLQTIVSNFVSGIILLIERPISKGDWIEVGGLMGYVRDISVRSTRIETFDRTDVIVPNSDLISGTVTNYTRGNTIGRVIVPVGVAYGTDTKRVEGILGEIANAHPMVLADPPPRVVFQGFGESSLDFEIRAILRDVNWVLAVKSDMNHEIAQRFVEEGIEIPFAQRDVWLRNPGAMSEIVPPENGLKPDLPGGPVEMTEADLDGGETDE